MHHICMSVNAQRRPFQGRCHFTNNHRFSGIWLQLLVRNFIFLQIVLNKCRNFICTYGWIYVLADVSAPSTAPAARPSFPQPAPTVHFSCLNFFTSRLPSSFFKANKILHNSQMGLGTIDNIFQYSRLHCKGIGSHIINGQAILDGQYSSISCNPLISGRPLVRQLYFSAFSHTRSFPQRFGQARCQHRSFHPSTADLSASEPFASSMISLSFSSTMTHWKSPRNT